MNQHLLRQVAVVVGALLVVFSGLWLAMLAMTHNDPMPATECVTVVTDCAQNPDHLFHMLIYRLKGISFIAAPTALDQQLLVKLLVVIGLGTIVAPLIELSNAYHLRRSLRFRELVRFASFARFRAWQVTIQELHPSIAH